MRAAKRSAVVVMLLPVASATAALAGEVVQVKISDLAFSPAEITVRVGDIVEWVNSDFIDHTATANAGSWDVMVAAGASARLSITNAGGYDYYCRFHPNMTGKIHVSAD